MYCKLAVEAKLHFHINSDVMNSIVLITWVTEVLLLLLLLLLLLFFYFFFPRVGRAARTPGEPIRTENRI